MCFNYNLILFIVFVIFVSFLSHSTQLTQNELGVPPEYCFQERPEKFDKLNEDCLKFSTEFCSNVQCEPIDEERCKEDENTDIVQNITGRGCCPACVQFIDEDETCEIRSKLKRCRNGLFCNPSTKKCNLPPKTKRCMTEVHNRRFVSKEGISFYVEGKAKNTAQRPMYFQLKYAREIEFPTCAAQSGEYEPKQCRGSKCFCVRPDDGQFTFGLSLEDSTDGSSANVTCACAEKMRKTLDTGKVERPYMEHYAQTHSKCDSAGNFEKLQCINQTCFCVDERTGKPTDERVAMYGALLSLTCFDKEKRKTLGTADSDLIYLNACEKQLMRTQQVSLHFMDKGTDIIGLDKIKCSYDGNFAPKQCGPGECACVKPDDAGINMGGSFKAERSGGKDSEMNCRCARQVYYANIEKKSYARPQCEGNGNYKAFQSFDNGRYTYCVDENGVRISEMIPSVCFDQFVKDIEPGLSGLKDVVCIAMRDVLTERVLTMNTPDYYFDFTMKNYRPLDERPKDNQLYCKNSVLSPSVLEKCGC